MYLRVLVHRRRVLTTFGSVAHPAGVPGVRLRAVDVQEAELAADNLDLMVVVVKIVIAHRTPGSAETQAICQMHPTKKELWCGLLVQLPVNGSLKQTRGRQVAGESQASKRRRRRALGAGLAYE